MHSMVMYFVLIHVHVALNVCYKHSNYIFFSSKFSSDTKLCQAGIELYSVMYGRLTPTCLPQGVSDYLFIIRMYNE